MIRPDDSILSAYLDGELDPRRALVVERALTADPKLAKAIEDLRSVKALVAGLPRPEAPDLSGVVLARLSTPPSLARAWGRRLGGLAGAAAMIAAAILLHRLPANGPAPQPERQPRRITGETTPPSELAARSERSLPGASTLPALDERPRGGPTARNDSPAPSREAPARSLALNASDPTESPDVLRVRRLLDDPRLHRVFLLTDRIDRPLEPEIAALVERTTRHDFFKITVAEGIVIDPKHPGKATVFAVVLDRSALEPFRDRLRAQFADRAQEAEIDPTIPLQLAEIGQVVSLPPDPAGDVTIPPPTSLALREEARSSGGHEEADPSPPPFLSPAELKDRQRSRPSPDSMATRVPEGSETGRPVGRDLRGIVREGSHGRTPETVASRASPSALPSDLGPVARSSHSAGTTRGQVRDAALDDKDLCVVLVWIAGPG